MSDTFADPARDGGQQELMDELLRAGVPEIKLALGQLIDRENARPLPPKYARLLPESILSVTLRPDAAAALTPIAADLERELTDSCNRHGSLYDRSYRVQLQRSSEGDAPLYAVASHAAKELPGGTEPPSVIADAPEAATARPSSRATAALAGEGSAPVIPQAPADATRIGSPATPGWEPGRWLLVVEDTEGEPREAFRLGEPLVTVGRGSDDPQLRASIAISDAPHVSRRQLALVWEERDGAPGFRVFNLGLNAIHLPGLDIPGAHTGKGLIDLDSMAAEHAGWLPPGVPLKIGEHGPTLRIDDVPPDPDEVAVDPDATVFE
jgi:hypothetical protein